MEALLLTSAFFGIFAFLVWLAQRIEAVIHRVKYPLKGANFKVHEIPLSPDAWKRFCNLAEMRDTSQKRQLAEAVQFFMEQKVK